MTFRKILTVFFVLVGIILAVFIVGDIVRNNGGLDEISDVQTKESEKPKDESITISIGDKVVTAQIADDDIERAKGLGGRESLAQDEGLLFIFEVPAKYGFYMKDMNFPIDIIWMNDTKEVIGVHKNISTSTFNDVAPEIFYPVSEVKYVLEVNSGYSERLNIATGTILSF